MFSLATPTDKLGGMMATSLWPDDSVRRLLARINSRLEQYLQRPERDCPPRLREAMAYSLLSGGKRLRPLIVLLACEACGGDAEAALPAACAVEMVHTYSLVHDDLPAMDDDATRRGRPSCHIQFDEATAILVGDALLTMAFEVLAGHVHPPAVAAACCAELARAIGACGMVGGQMADLQAEREQGSGSRSQQSRVRGQGSGVRGQGSGVRSQGSAGRQGTTDDGRRTTDNGQLQSSIDNRQSTIVNPSAAHQHLESIHRRKTGCLIAVSAVMGGRIAGGDAAVLAALDSYGKSVGLAFQIADDLLDTTGRSDQLGKATRKDADRGKLTYPALIGEAASRRRAETLIEEACRAVEPLGPAAERLVSLARFVLRRDH